MLRHDTCTAFGLLQIVPEHTAPQYRPQIGVLFDRAVECGLQDGWFDRLGQLAGQSEDRGVRPVNRRRENFSCVVQPVPVRFVLFAHTVSTPKNFAMSACAR